MGIRARLLVAVVISAAIWLSVSAVVGSWQQ
jgi:hypothetical protein